MENATVELVGKGEDGAVVLTEKKTYQASIEDVRRQIETVRYHKEALIEQSKKLKRDYQELEEKEQQLQEILKAVEQHEEVEVLG